MNLAYIRSNAEILVHKYNVKCIFIESIQSIFHAEEIDNPIINKELICIELKNMAQELHVPFILTSDLSETLEQRKGLKGKQPKITDLVYADSITDIADSIFLLFNPTYYKRRICRPMEEDEPLETFYVNIAQNKYESTGIVSLTFNPNNGFIEDDSNISATPSPALQKFIEEFDLIPLSNMFD
jgi:replicative DNA helicase